MVGLDTALSNVALDVCVYVIAMSCNLRWTLLSSGEANLQQSITEDDLETSSYANVQVKERHRYGGTHNMEQLHQKFAYNPAVYLDDIDKKGVRD